jgi:hypothetical protein
MPEFHSTFVGELAVGDHHEAHQGMCVCDPFGPRLCPRRSNLPIRAGGSRALGCWGRSANRRLGPAPQRTLLDRVDVCARGGLVSRLGQPSFPVLGIAWLLSLLRVITPDSFWYVRPFV